MSKQTVNIGAAANDGTGDPLRTGFGKINDNFDELYVTGFNGYIQGCYLTFDAAGTLGAAAGSLDIDGTRYTNAAAITLSLSGLTTGLNYVYAKANDSAWAMECSTTAPAWDATLNYWKKTGDDTRRRIGMIYALTSSTALRFSMSAAQASRRRRITYGDDVLYDSPAPVVNGVIFDGTAWQSADASATLPQSCLRALLRWYYVPGGVATTVNFGLATSNLSPGGFGGLGEVLEERFVSGEIYLEHELETSSTSFYWITSNNHGDPSFVYLGIRGYEFEV